MNDEEKVLAAFGQLNRNDEFKIITKIVKKHSKLLVRKEAYTNTAIPHLEKLKYNQEIISKALAGQKRIRLAEIIESGEMFIAYEYVYGQNVENETFKAIMSHDYEKAINTIDTIFALIDDLSVKRDKKEISSVKEINDIYKHSNSSKCFTSPAVVDLNLDNFIISSNNELVLFDCEWVFDQPIDSEFIKTRLLHTFFARRSEAFAYLPSEQDKFILMVESDNQTLIPAKIYDKFSNLLDKKAMRKYWKAEDVFQGSVNKFRKSTAQTSINSLFIEEITSPQPTFPEIDEITKSNYASLSANFETILTQYKAVEEELDRLKSSTPYKAARKIVHAKRRVSKSFRRTGKNTA